jgi:hypothetical protein
MRFRIVYGDGLVRIIDGDGHVHFHGVVIIQYTLNVNAKKFGNIVIGQKKYLLIRKIYK